MQLPCNASKRLANDEKNSNIQIWSPKVPVRNKNSNKKERLNIWLQKTTQFKINSFDHYFSFTVVPRFFGHTQNFKSSFPKWKQSDVTNYWSVIANRLIHSWARGSSMVLSGAKIELLKILDQSSMLNVKFIEIKTRTTKSKRITKLTSNGWAKELIYWILLIAKVWNQLV